MKATKFYTVDDVCVLLRMTSKTVEARLLAGELGHAVNVGTERRPDYRIPASGIKAYVKSHGKDKSALGTAARSVGQLRRKTGRAI